MTSVTSHVTSVADFCRLPVIAHVINRHMVMLAHGQGGARSAGEAASGGRNAKSPWETN